MVYLVLTPQGLQEILAAPEAANVPVWCGGDVLSEEEFERMERRRVTRFTFSIADADEATMKCALATIEDHHPGERIWVETIVCES